MEENLAYLPLINSYNQASHTEKYYYVYRYKEESVLDAKESDNYKALGMLYNWEAAKASCPEGWHLPSIDEWTVLSDYLYNNNFGYGGRGDKIAKSLASRSGWNGSTEYGSVGNNLSKNNSSGFNAQASGFHLSFGTYFYSTLNPQEIQKY
jgi:uncharacterized protein (TIGR02145 family)